MITPSVRESTTALDTSAALEHLEPHLRAFAEYLLPFAQNRAGVAGWRSASWVEEPLTITSERVDDLPVLVAQWERMGLAPLLDAHCPTHGRWGGLSLGRTALVWLVHVLWQADHRLNQVPPWVERRRDPLGACLAQPVRALDVADDRLAAILAALSDDARWAAFEGALTGRLLRVYDLATERVRLDTTPASGYWQVTPEGLCQFGHRQDHRPDLPQVKILRATLDPLALPLATDLVSGERADDPLSLPAMARGRAGLGRTGLLSVGDGTLAALGTRAGCPLGDCRRGRLLPVPAPRHAGAGGGPGYLARAGRQRDAGAGAQRAGRCRRCGRATGGGR